MRLLVVTNLTNIFYLTGFRGSAGVAVFGPSDACLWVDPRYALQAREQTRGVEVIEEKAELFKAVGRWVRRKKPRRVGYEDADLSCLDFRSLEREAGRLVRLEPVGEMVEELRAVKSREEIERIRQAGRLTAEVFAEVFPLVRPGVRESDLAAEIEYRIDRKSVV